MKKVAFYLDNNDLPVVNCTDILKGNPGIGGTEYMIVLIATLLSLRDNGIKVVLLCTKELQFPEDLTYKTVANIDLAIDYVNTNGYDYLVLVHRQIYVTNRVFDNRILSTKLIVWCHIFLTKIEIDYYADCANIWHIVNVGREMNDLYRDHKIFCKSSYIYNCVNLDETDKLVSSHPFSQRKNIVTYLGCIKPYKGLHLLAQAWPNIIKEVPDAELFIIGSSQLYNYNCRVGKYGLIEEPYEKMIMQYLTDDFGVILPSVHFMGNLGIEKQEILLQTKVGVPNPSGLTETFGIAAVEMQALGARVTTKKCPGHLDTVKNGILYTKKESLAKCIITLLKTSDTMYDEALRFFLQNFSYSSVVKQWENLFLQVRDFNYRKHISNINYRFKWMKEILRRIKMSIPVLYNIIPPVEQVVLYVERRILKIKSYMQ